MLTPAYEGRFNGPSLPAFSRMGKVILLFHLSFILSYKDQWHRSTFIHDCDDLAKMDYTSLLLLQVFLINEVGADSFLQRVEEFEEENCI